MEWNRSGLTRVIGLFDDIKPSNWKLSKSLSSSDTRWRVWGSYCKKYKIKQVNITDGLVYDRQTMKYGHSHIICHLYGDDYCLVPKRLAEKVLILGFFPSVEELEKVGVE